MLASLTLACAATAFAPQAPASLDSALPRFRATDVRVVRDTAWFFSTAPQEGITRHVMVGFVPASRSWIRVVRRWRDSDAVNSSIGGGGPIEASSGAIETMSAPYRVESAPPSPDDSRERPLILADSSHRRTMLRLVLTPAERRRLYLLANGDLAPHQSAPAFGMIPTWWAAGNGRLAFAFPAAPPPKSDVAHYTLPEKEQRYPPVLSGILIVDSATRRATTLASPTLIERGWLGLALVGDALFAAPAQIDDALDYAHAPARSRAPQLARYSSATKRWTFIYARDLPFAASSITAIAADCSHLYVAADKHIAVLDTRTGAWSPRFYNDTSYVLADGADTTVTRLIATPPVAAQPPAPSEDDSANNVHAFVDRLHVRHRAALERVILDSLPNEQVRDIGGYVLEMERRADELGDIETPFGSFNDTIAVELAQPAFVPYLHESMRTQETMRFAAQSLGHLGDRYLRDALLETLDSGTVAAAIWAAETLIKRGDPEGVRWLRAQIADSTRSIDEEPDLGFQGGWSLSRIAFDLAAHDDSASLSRMIALLRTPDGKLATEGSHLLLDAMSQFPSLDAQRRIARAIEARPWLWTWYAFQMQRPENRFANDPEIRALVTRMANAERAPR